MTALQQTPKDPYSSLSEILDLAYLRASEGKGKERHADDKNFEDQDICEELRIFDSISPALFQIRKKTKETRKLSKEQSINELLDTIVYSAAAVLVLKESK